MIDKLRSEFLGALAPLRCHWCGTRTARLPCCDGCRAALPWNERACRACALPLPRGALAGACADCLRAAPPQARSWTAFRYEAPIDDAIVALKFNGRLGAAHALGTLMAQRLALRAEPLPELLIPVPLHQRRLRLRGYNQALELARALARCLPVRLVPRLARRARPTPEQTRLSAAERRRNVRGAFVIDPRVRGRSVAVFDDVITTGATVAAVARAAVRAGAASVEVWAAARVG